MSGRRSSAGRARVPERQQSDVVDLPSCTEAHHRIEDCRRKSGDVGGVRGPQDGEQPLFLEERSLGLWPVTKLSRRDRLISEAAEN